MLFLVGIHIAYDQQHGIKLIKHNFYTKNINIFSTAVVFAVQLLNMSPERASIGTYTMMFGSLHKINVIIHTTQYSVRVI